MDHFERFARLHSPGNPLLLANVWDAGSAKLVEQSGSKAIATSSAAVALSMGYEDGENLPFELLLETVIRIKKTISLPLSVDIERGYSNDTREIIQNIERLCDVGVAGINIEDSTADGKLQEAGLFEKKLLAITEHLAQNKQRIFINARTDAFLLKIPDALSETKMRMQLYERAGANGIFVPFITDVNDVREVVNSTMLPVNVLSVPQVTDIVELTALGVARISMGSFFYRSVNKEMINKLLAIQQDSSFKHLF
ncbi:MAG: isocitrate lyase/phosphoenolpyruvate mutase family protein [Ferruginibacter sp.]